MSPQVWLTSVCVLVSLNVVPYQGPAAATTAQPLTVLASASSGEGSSLSVTTPSATAATTQPLLAVGNSSTDTFALFGSMTVAVTASTEGSSLSLGLSSEVSVPAQDNSSTTGQDLWSTGRPELGVVSLTWPAPVDSDSSFSLRPSTDSPTSFVSDATASSSTSTMPQLTKDNASSISETLSTTSAASSPDSAAPGPLGEYDTSSVSPSDTAASSMLTTDGAAPSAIFTLSVLTTDGLTSSILASDSSSGLLTVDSMITGRSTSEINTAVEEQASSTVSHTTGESASGTTLTVGFTSEVFTASPESSATVEVETPSASPTVVRSTSLTVPGSTQSLVTSETTLDPMQENTTSSLTSQMASMISTPSTSVADTTSPQSTHVSATGASETQPEVVTSPGKVTQLTGSGSTQAVTESGGERSQVPTETTYPFTAPTHTHQPSESSLTVASSSQTTAIIVGSVVGGLAAVVVAGVLIFVLCRRKSSSSPNGSSASPQRNGSSVRPVYGPKYKNPLFNLTTTASGSGEP